MVCPRPQNAAGAEYGIDRLAALAASANRQPQDDNRDVRARPGRVPRRAWSQRRPHASRPFAGRRLPAYRFDLPTSGRGSATKPSRFGILTFGRLLASITALFSMMPLRFRMYADHRVHFRRLQQTRLIERHGAIDVIPHRRGIGPVAAHGLEGLRACASVPRPPTSAGPTRSFCLLPVAFGAPRRENLPPCRDRPRAFRQSASVRRNRCAQVANLLRRRRPSDSVLRRLRRQRGGASQHRLR